MTKTMKAATKMAMVITVKKKTGTRVNPTTRRHKTTTKTLRNPHNTFMKERR